MTTQAQPAPDSTSAGSDAMSASESASPSSDLDSLFARRWMADNRLSLTFKERALLSICGGFTGGLVLGVVYGSKTAALRFRAENAHRLPTTPTGWYQYHKSKHYNVAFEGLKTGARMGLRLPGWVVGFVFLEDSVDRLRGRIDAFSTVVAGLTLSGIFSLKSWFLQPQKQY